MCGIAGHIGRSPANQEKINKSLLLMKKRGPDHQSYKLFEDESRKEKVYTSLLHSRLSILDLDERSNQPFTIGPCTLVFNGEIYNYLELKKELEKEGYFFSTSSDTEVLLNAYLAYGHKCVEKFEGMWSFAVWDSRQNELFISRDRFGEKPLYFFQNESGIYFASEIKVLKSLSGDDFDINYDQLLRYLFLGYKSLYKKEQQFLKKIKALPRASSMVIRGSDYQIHRYWIPEADTQKMSLQEAVQGSKQLLTSSMKIRSRADVPLAYCLSGGIDSSALASLAVKELNQKITTFSILDTDERYNEYKNITATINDLGCDHTLIDLDTKNSIEKLRNLIQYHDSPISTISYYTHSLLSEQINKAGFKVAVSGTGADELYTGYYDHFLLQLAELDTHPDKNQFLSDFNKYVATFIRNENLKNPDLYKSNPEFREHIFDNSHEYLGWMNNEYRQGFDSSFTEKQFSNSLMKNRMLNELFEEIIPVILHEDDLNSMCYSVENRSPYLDSKLMEFMFSVPSEYLIRDGYGKYLLRESTKGILNDEVRLDRKKVGFNASINSLFKLDGEQIKDEFLQKSNAIFDFVNFEKVAALFNEEFLPNSHSKFIFNLINSQIYLEQNL